MCHEQKYLTNTIKKYWMLIKELYTQKDFTNIDNLYSFVNEKQFVINYSLNKSDITINYDGNIFLTDFDAYDNKNKITTIYNI